MSKNSKSIFTMANWNNLVEKLLDPVQEIRQRAFDSIAEKVEVGLINIKDPAISSILASKLRTWISNGWIPRKGQENLFQSLLNQPDLDQFQTSKMANDRHDQNGDYDHPTPSIQDVIENNLESGDSLSFQSEALPPTPTLDTSREPKKHDITLPSRFLASASSPADSTWNKPQTPLHREYFKAVKFAENSDILLNELTFPMVNLSQDEKIRNEQFVQVLRTNDHAKVTEVLQDLTYRILSDNATLPESFLQNPTLLHLIMEKFTFTSIPTIRDEAANFLSFLGEKLIGRAKFLQECSSLNASDINLSQFETEESLTIVDFFLITISSLMSTFRSVSSTEEFQNCLNLGRSVLEIGKIIQFANIWRGHDRRAMTFQEISKDFLADFTQAYKHFAARREATSTNRVFQLNLLQLALDLATFFPIDTPCFHDIARDALTDPNLLFTHENIHEKMISLASHEIKKELSETKVLFRRFDMAIKLLNGQSKRTEILGDAREALVLFPIHQSNVIVKRIFEIVASNQYQDSDRHELMLLLLHNRDSKIRTESVFVLHAIIQDSLGAKAAALSSVDEIENKISFLFVTPKIIEFLFTDGLLNRTDANVRRACEDAIRYLINADILVSKKFSEKMKKIICMHLTPFGLAASSESVFGNFVLDTMSLRENNSSSSLTLSRSELLECNMRFLFDKNVSVRKRGELNLKLLLGQEKFSDLKLPRFPSIVENDISHVFVNLSAEPLPMSSTEIKQDDLEELVRSLENLSSLKSLKTSLAKLEMLVTFESTREEFKKLQGLQVVKDLLNKVLTEDPEQDLLSKLPKVVTLLKTMASVGINFANDVEFLTNLVRAAFITCDDPTYIQDLAIVWFLTLFKSYCRLESEQTYADALCSHKVNVPFTHRTCQKTLLPHEMTSEPKLHPNFFPLLKTYWYIAMASEPNSHRYSAELTMTDGEIQLLRNSRLENISVEMLQSLKNAKTHDEFLERLNGLRLLMSCNNQCFGLISSKLKNTFQRFLLTPPKTKKDTMIFTEILDFLGFALSYPDATDHFSWLSQMSKKLHIFTLLGLAGNGRNFVKTTSICYRFYVQLQKAFPEEDYIQDLPADAKVLSMAINFSSQTVLRKMHSDQRLEAFAILMDDLETEQGNKIELLNALAKIVSTSSELTISWPERWNKIARFFQNSCPLIRYLSLKIMLYITQGPNYFQVNGGDNAHKLWITLTDRIKSDAETYLSKAIAIQILSNLMKTSDEYHWHGPIAYEPVSRMKIVGEGALPGFVKEKKVDQFFLNELQNFRKGYYETTKRNGNVTKMILALLETVLVFTKKCFTTFSNLQDVITAALDSLANEELEWETSTNELDYTLLVIELLKIILVTNVDNSNNSVASILAKVNVMLSRDNCPFSNKQISLLCKSTCNLLSAWLSRSETKKSNDCLLALLKYLPRFFNDCQRFGFLVLNENAAMFSLVLKSLSFYRETNGWQSLVQMLRRPSKTYQKLLPRVVRDFCKSLAINENWTQSCALNIMTGLSVIMSMCDVSQIEALDQGLLPLCEKRLAKVISLINVLHESKHKRRLLLVIEYVLQCLNNLCYRNVQAKNLLLQSSVLDLLAQLQHHHSNILQVIPSLVSFLRNASIQCPEFRVALAQNRSLIDKVIHGTGSFNWATEIYRWAKSDMDKEDKTTRELIMILGLSPEPRKILMRSDLISSLLESSIRYNKELESKFLLDLLITITTFADGQTWLIQGSNILEDFLLPNIFQRKNIAKRMLALSVIRNLAFQPSNVPRLLLQSQLLSELQETLKKNSIVSIYNSVTLQILWRLSSSSKSRTTLQRVGIIKAMGELATNDQVGGSQLVKSICKNLKLQ